MSRNLDLLKESQFRELLDEKMSEVGISYTGMADEIGVDPSTVSRSLQNGSTKYRHYHTMWEVIREREDPPQPSAESLMVGEMTWTHASETRAEAADKMQDNDFSQLPVKADGEAVGWVTDFSLMENPVPDRPVAEMVGKSMITVGPNDTQELVKSILEEGYPAVLVEESSEYKGIVTRFDLL